VVADLIIKWHGDCQAKKGALQLETRVMKIKHNVALDLNQI
jgi:hypothetical protein